MTLDAHAGPRAAHHVANNFRALTPDPMPLQGAAISPRIAGSSMWPAWSTGPIGDLLHVPRRIFPDRVFGSRATVMAILKPLPAVFSRTSATISFSISVGGVDAGLEHDEAARRLALSSSFTPMTAHSRRQGASQHSSMPRWKAVPRR